MIIYHPCDKKSRFSIAWKVNEKWDKEARKKVATDLVDLKIDTFEILEITMTKDQAAKLILAGTEFLGLGKGVKTAPPPAEQTPFDDDPDF